ncbi:hypothetical protein BCR44DRAFT_224855 [Catenaria anguillulae PL171]|uniref:Uncharacterized protein n=1 Tax=Catenaria anguillulae PL171 TaxID=765915 RepID=A0A1Y2HF03_9FUNG|nr:hypothetical protein BCR44DRAFT_224855 [Catenaria anguillulae PL171]
MMHRHPARLCTRRPGEAAGTCLWFRKQAQRPNILVPIRHRCRPNGQCDWLWPCRHGHVKRMHVCHVRGGQCVGLRHCRRRCGRRRVWLRRRRCELGRLRVHVRWVKRHDVARGQRNSGCVRKDGRLAVVSVAAIGVAGEHGNRQYVMMRVIVRQRRRHGRRMVRRPVGVIVLIRLQLPGNLLAPNKGLGRAGNGLERIERLAGSKLAWMADACGRDFEPWHPFPNGHMLDVGFDNDVRSHVKRLQVTPSANLSELIRPPGYLDADVVGVRLARGQGRHGVINPRFASKRMRLRWESMVSRWDRSWPGEWAGSQNARCARGKASRLWQ